MCWKKNKSMDIERLNTAVRGQIILGSDPAGDIEAINGMIKLGAYMRTLSMEGKKQTMLGAVAGSLAPHTFGISYTGRISWGGMERYLCNAAGQESCVCKRADKRVWQVRHKMRYRG